MEQIYKDLAQFMAEHIEDYELRIQLALKRIDRNRCGLQQADNDLYNKIYEVAAEYIEDNNIALDIDELDIETIFFN